MHTNTRQHQGGNQSITTQPRAICLHNLLLCEKIVSRQINFLVLHAHIFLIFA